MFNEMMGMAGMKPATPFDLLSPEEQERLRRLHAMMNATAPQNAMLADAGGLLQRLSRGSDVMSAAERSAYKAATGDQIAGDESTLAPQGSPAPTQLPQSDSSVTGRTYDPEAVRAYLARRQALEKAQMDQRMEAMTRRQEQQRLEETARQRQEQINQERYKRAQDLLKSWQD
jgi:hypothetical protein